MLKAEKLGRQKSWLDGRIAGGQLSGSMTCHSKFVMLYRLISVSIDFRKRMIALYASGR